jgi:hypothetical protein
LHDGSRCEALVDRRGCQEGTGRKQSPGRGCEASSNAATPHARAPSARTSARVRVSSHADISALGRRPLARVLHGPVKLIVCLLYARSLRIEVRSDPFHSHPPSKLDLALGRQAFRTAAERPTRSACLLPGVFELDDGAVSRVGGVNLPNDGSDGLRGKAAA